MGDIIKVLRLVEYIGPRKQIEDCIQKSIHGTQKYNGMSITAVTIGEFPLILKGSERADIEAVIGEFGREI